MKTVILAGGLGTRLSEETTIRPKPLVEIGGKPILWHIMKYYSHFGFNDFVVCCGFKGYAIKEYFSNYFLHTADVTLNIAKNSMTVHQNYAEPWNVTLIDTGEHTQTGGRVKRIKSYIKDDEAFCLTYGDGLSNVHLQDLVDFHFRQGKSATVTAVSPPGRFGVLELDGHQVTGFREKPTGSSGLINGGFFVLSPKVLDLIADDDVSWEDGVMTQLADLNELVAFKHSGFWQPMDTLREKHYLERRWSSNDAPWKVWK